MPSKKNRGKRKANSNNRSMVVFQRIPCPPTYTNNTRVKRFFRYQYLYTATSSLTTFNISPAKIGCLQVIGTGATTAVGLYEYGRIMTMKMWASPPTDGTVVNISLVCNSGTTGTFGNDITRSAQTIGMTEPAALIIRPKSNSQSGQFQSLSTTNNVTWFTMNVAGTNPGVASTSVVTIDIFLDLYMSNDSRTSGNQVVLTSSAAGSIYYLALDNPGGASLSGSSLWIPDRGLVTTSFKHPSTHVEPVERHLLSLPAPAATYVNGNFKFA